MFPRRLPPSAPAQSASAASGTPPAESGELPAQNGFPNSVPAQILPRPATSPSTAASARKRSLPLPVTPRPTRPRTEAGLLQAAPAVPPRSHAALQRQTQAFSAIAKALGHFGGMTWLTLDETHRQALLAASTAPHPPDGTETEQRQQHLHAVLSAMQQTTQDMDWLASRPPLSPRVIEPAMLTAFVPAVYEGQMTIDGPHRDEAGQLHFYLERQDGHACAQHAVNAMVGGPLVSLVHFAQWEAHVQAQQDVTPAALTQSVTAMLAQGVHLETVQGTLQALGMPTHLYAHRPIAHVQGLDPVQARFLDGLPTDRLLLQADRYEGNSTSSHYVAFRRDGGQWVLLDSLHGAPQYGVAPSAYLLRDEKILHFAALWPQHALQELIPAGAERDAQAGAEPLVVASMGEHPPSRSQESGAGTRVKEPRKRTVRARSKVERQFLAGLVPYAAGKTLEECERESGLAGFHIYLSAAGGLRKAGQALYAKLLSEQQAKVDKAIEARKVGQVVKAMETESTLEKFLAGLEPYAAGKELKECERECGLASFSSYLSAVGGLHEQGQALYAKLPPEQQAEVDQAIEARKAKAHQDTKSPLEKFLAGLVPYAAGKMLKECERESGLAAFENYLSDKGELQKRGQALYDKLPPEQKAEVDQAIEARKALNRKFLIEKFLAGLAPYAAGKSLVECERESGLAAFENYLSDKGELQKRGQALYGKLPPEQQAKVNEAIERRKVALIAKAMDTESTLEKFLAGLKPYVAGKTLEECERESGLAAFYNYLSTAGGLRTLGQALYAKLPLEQQAKVDKAIERRKVVKAMDTESTLEKFLAGLGPYATGKSLAECGCQSGLAGFQNYLSNVGGLPKIGRALYDKLLPEQQAEVDAARLSRTVWFARTNIDSKRFLDAIRRFSSSSLQIEAIGQAAGLKKGHLGLLLCDTGLTEAGRRYVEEKFNPQEQEEIQRCIRLRVSPP